jgi:M6 family metalloprotease-like protein
VHPPPTRVPTTLRALAGAAVAAGSLAVAAPSSALIVVNGKVAQSWPDQPAPRAAPGTAAQVSSEGFYPRPQGTVWGLTLVVDFSDQAPSFTKEQVEAWLNEPGYSQGGVNGSIRDYFWENSNGQIDFQNEVVGFYRASQPKAYYEAGSGYSRATELVNEIIEYFDDEVDFSRFDNDGDGNTEAISIVYAGPAEEFAQGLWPHAGGIGTTRDGVRLSRYQMSQMGNSLGLYTFAHEVGHMLFGWPDLYGFGNYCIMGNSSSSTNPVGINDFYRADQGWIPVIDIDATTNARYQVVANAGGYRYVNPARPEESFFWSNVRNTDRWSSLDGSGILLLHFDYEIRNNNPPNPLSLAVVQADGLRQLDETQWPMPGSDEDDFFHAGTSSEVSDSTSPSTHFNDGDDSGLRIYEISADGDMMTFAVGTGTPGPGLGGAGGTGGAGPIPTGGTSGTGAGAGGQGGTGPTQAGGASGMGGTTGGVGGIADGGASAGGAPAGGSPLGTAGGPIDTGTGGATAGSGVLAPGSPGGGESGCACQLGRPRGSRLAWLVVLTGLAIPGIARRRRRLTAPTG